MRSPILSVQTEICPVCYSFIPDHREGTCSKKCQNKVEIFHKRCAEAKLSMQMMGFKCTWQNECQLDIILPLGMAYLYPSISQSFNWPEPRHDISVLGSEALINYVDSMLGFNLLAGFHEKFMNASITYEQMCNYRDMEITKHFHDDNFATPCENCHVRRMHGLLSFDGDKRLCLDCLSGQYPF